MIVGYVKKTKKAACDKQIKELVNYGVKKKNIFYDLEDIKKIIKNGDSIYITNCYRLGKDIQDCLKIVLEFKLLGVDVRFIKDGIYTDGSVGESVITIFSVLLKSEKLRVMEKTNDARIEAKKNGVSFGRKRKLDRNKILELYRSGVGATKIAKDIKIARSTVYKIINDENLISR